MTSDRQQARAGLSVTTLMIASASSLAAAIVVSKLWGGGTLIGAAMTPVIVTLVSEGLRRPATVIGTVRDTRAGRFDPLAEGRRGLREGDLDTARSPMPAAAVAERRVHRASGRAGGGGRRLRLTRPRVIAAVVTGLVAFVLAGVLLTGSELVLGKSVVSASKRTTYIPVHRSASSSTTKDKTDTTTTKDTTTTTTPTTTSTPAEPPATATTPTAPPAQETSPTPPTTTAPPQTAPPPATPAPQSATPPPATTP